MWSGVVGEILTSAAHVSNRVLQTGAMKEGSSEQHFKTKALWSNDVGNAACKSLPEGLPHSLLWYGSVPQKPGG
jgi:hypothetical protein